MNRIILIGNGFDLAHGYSTGYDDFINWYWDKRVNSFIGNHSSLSKDCLCAMKVISPYNCWSLFGYSLPRFNKISGKEVIESIKNQPESYEFTLTPFFKSICESIDNKGWVDIEREYYNHLKLALEATGSDDNNHLIKQLNEQLEYIRSLLVEYLKSIQFYIRENEDIFNIIYGCFDPDDISISGQIAYKQHCEDYGTLIPNGTEYEIHFGHKEYSLPCRVLLLNFNYTPIAAAYLLTQIEELKYGADLKSEMIYIHGDITKPKTLIFGYGDELDDAYSSILKNGNHEYLRYIKSIKYLETDNYRKLLEFIESDNYQIYIMGHSCGNSDGTLLNTLFEHRNCVSIKPYYHKKNDGSDNYMDIVQSICCNFTDMKLFRERVVCKTNCIPMPQCSQEQKSNTEI